MAKRSGLDGRYRDEDGTIRRKNGNTQIGTLRQTYGPDFAEGYRSDMKLENLLDRENESSLTSYLNKKHG